MCFSPAQFTSVGTDVVECLGNGDIELRGSKKYEMQLEVFGRFFDSGVDFDKLRLSWYTHVDTDEYIANFDTNQIRVKRMQLPIERLKAPTPKVEKPLSAWKAALDEISIEDSNSEGGKTDEKNDKSEKSNSGAASGKRCKAA